MFTEGFRKSTRNLAFNISLNFQLSNSFTQVTAQFGFQRMQDKFPFTKNFRAVDTSAPQHCKITYFHTCSVSLGNFM